MAQITNTARIVFTADLTLSEGEMRVLSELAKAGTEDIFSGANPDQARFIPAMRRLFKSIREQVDPALAEIDKARKDLAEAATKRGQTQPGVPAIYVPSYWDGDYFDGGA